MMLLLLAAASATPGLAVGLGDATCAVAMTPDHEKRSFDYALGIWSGLNLAANKPVGRSLDPRGLLEAVVAACAAAPTQPFADAIVAVRNRYDREGR